MEKQNRKIKYKNKDPLNPYKPRSMKAALYEEDFSDLTLEQIAEVFDVFEASVRNTIIRIKIETGKTVKYRKKGVKDGIDK